MLMNSRICSWSLVLLLLIHIGWCQQRHCKELRCGRHGVVRFPFRLKDKHPAECGYPGFDITCYHHRHLLLQLPTPSGSVDLFIKHIDYPSQSLQAYDPQNCLPALLLKLHNSTISPFKFESATGFESDITFLNCSSNGLNGFRSRFQNIDMFSCPIYVGYSEIDFMAEDLLFCTKMINISSNQLGNILQNNVLFSWMKPNCTGCERKGQMCQLMKNKGTKDDIECVDHDPKISRSTIKLIAGLTSGSVVLLLVLLVLCQYYRYLRLKEEDLARLQKFLEDYRLLKPTRFTFVDLERITCGFIEKLGEGAHGAVFKGKLSDEILVAVKMLNNSKDDDGREFINEMGVIAKIHHVNVVRLLGFCADGIHHALVYDYFPNGSLQNFVSAPNGHGSFLGWEKLQQIALSIARGIEYLHHGCDHQILHFDINPHNILLDDNFIPKISDFGLAKLCPKNKNTVSVTAARGTIGYIAPEVFFKNFGNVSYKSDIYSFGMLLIEMVGGRKNTDTIQEKFQVLYPEWIHSLVEGGDIHIPIENEEDIRIAKRLAIVGLWCIQWHAINRPSMNKVVQMLEGDEDNKLEVPPTPFDSSSINTTMAAPARHLGLELEVIHELE
ncbi:hypothetical protein QN277_015526 [Acacia crassicarpa]|uniref:Protein kinase domain-containing protein n=1 Tax=Acacia crassicarpa TaxID=499986 RepID=A0AAE1MTH0_9FABA|nr:hypothetical protein QN277_015526 [Acacia crassicarpa]